MQQSSWQQLRSAGFRLAGFALVYLAGAELGRVLAFGPNLHTIRPELGVYLGALWMCRWRFGLLLGVVAVLAQILFDVLWQGTTASFSLQSSAIIAIEAWGAAGLLYFLRPVPFQLRRLEDHLRMFLTAGCASALGGALWAGLLHRPHGNNFNDWRVWWIIDAASLIVVAPLVWLTAKAARGHLVSDRRSSRWEEGWLLAALLFLCALMHGRTANELQALRALVLLLLLWTALRCGSVVTAWSTGLAVLFTLYFVSRHSLRVPAVEQWPAGTLLEAWLFTIISAVMFPILSAVVTNQWRNERELSRKNRKLDESLAQLEGLFAKAPLGLAFLDHNLRFLRANETLATLNNLPLEQHPGTWPTGSALPIWSLIEPFLRRTLEQGETIRQQQISGHLPPQSDRLRHVQISCWPVYLENSIQAVGLAVLENTSQRELQQTLTLQEHAISAVTQGIVITQARQAERPFYFVNAGFERLTGFSAAELRDQTWNLLAGAETDASSLARFQLSFRAELPCRVELLCYRKNGSPRWLDLSLTPLRNPGGRITHFVCVCSDITEMKRHEQALQESESLLNETGRMARVGGWELDATTLRIRWTQETYRIHELPVGIQPPLDDAINFYHPDDRSQLRSAIEQALQHGIPYDLELRFRTARGNPLWVRSICKPERHLGKTVRLAGVFQDVTARKQVEEQFRASEERFRTLAENLPDSLFVLDPDDSSLPFRILYANPTAAANDGYALEEIIGQSLSSALHAGETLRQLQLGMPRILAGETIEFEATHLHSDGHLVFYEVRALQMTWQGRPAILKIGRDLSERKQAEQEIRRRERLFRKLIEATAVGVWSIDAKGTMVRTEDSAAAMSLAEQWRNVHPEDLPRVRDQWRQALTHEQPLEVQARIRNSQGDWRECLLRAYPVFDETGKIEQWIGANSDITEHVQIEEQLRQSQKMEAIGRLAGGVAHDFNNLLTVINGYASLLLQSASLDDTQRLPLEEIARAGDRATRLTRQLLAFSRKQVLAPRNINLNDVVLQTGVMLRRVIGDDIQLTTRLDDDLGTILADPLQIEQILLNLVVNARDAMPGGGRLQIETRNVELTAQSAGFYQEGRPGLFAAMSVSDSGEGIPPEILPRIFEPFFTTKAMGQGTGLGLATVFGIVRQSEGCIRVLSEPGQGTTMTLLFPRVQQKKAETPPVLSPDVVGGSETLLLVEDEENVRRLALLMLTRHGYRVLEAGDARAALDLADHHVGQIHLLVTDVMMPQMNGRQLAEELTRRRPNLRVLFASGYSNDQGVLEGISDGRHAFLQKPYSATELLLKVRSILDATE